MSKTEKGPEKTGVNKGIEQGMSKEQFEGRVICKKCGKDIEYTLGSKLFLKCPRCGKRVERCLKDEEKKAKKIIKLDILLRSKRTHLIAGLIFVILGAGFTVLNFCLAVFAGTPIIPNNLWGLGFLTLPFILFGAFLIGITRRKSASKKYKFFAILSGLLVLIAIAITTICIPDVANWVRGLLNL